MKHIYCISGFGSDERVFSKLTFSGYETHFIQWIIPEKNDSISDYAKKLTQQIHHDNPILIGLSFGGMMSIEIAKLLSVEKIILVSSIKSFHEMPLWLRLSGKLKLNKIFPMRSFKLIEPLQDYNLGLEAIDEKELVHNYRKHINQQYCNWAINTILNWKNELVHKNLFHIHGNNDRIFPLKNIKANYIVNTGGHLMVMNRYKIVNEYIHTILNREMN